MKRRKGFWGGALCFAMLLSGCAVKPESKLETLDNSGIYHASTTADSKETGKEQGDTNPVETTKNEETSKQEEESTVPSETTQETTQEGTVPVETTTEPKPTEPEPTEPTTEKAPETTAPTTAPVVTPGVVDFEALAALDNKSIDYGNNRDDVDSLNRPSGCNWYRKVFTPDGGADFIAPAEGNLVYLTMDEGYEAGYTPMILDVLKEKNVKAVFFITKQFVIEHPELVERMIAEGHQLGNHTCAHPAKGMPSLGLEAEYADVKWLHDYVLDKWGYTMTLFRYPSGIFSIQSIALMNAMGYQPVFWSYAHKDWVLDAQPEPVKALADCLKYAHPGAIYLLHAVSKTNTDNMAAFIDGIRAQGLEFGVYPANGFYPRQGS